MRWSKDNGREATVPGAEIFLGRQTADGKTRGKRRRSFSPAIAVLFPLLAVFPALAQAPPAPGASRFVVVLDAAHGGDDPGAKLGKQAEKNLTLALSVKLRSLLVARGIAVVTTRESDANMDALARAEIANRANAAACLDLHMAPASAKNLPTVHLFLSSLPAANDVRLAPWQTAQAAWIPRSTALARLLHSALTQAGVLVTLGRTPLPGIDSMTCPAVAVEIAPQEDTAGAEDDFEARVLEALAAALVEWRSDAGRLGESQP
jgi:N-acetylmuramoyl-L-alanine amidase